MNINWKKGPKINKIPSLNLSRPKTYQLDNGTKLILIEGSGPEVVKIDIVFKGGRTIESHKLTARMCSAMLREGSKKTSAKALAEELDFYGVSLRSASNLDSSFITFSTLNKHLEYILPLISDVILSPTLSDESFEKYKQKFKDNLSIDLQKSELVSYREFTSILYGNDHPYGYNTTGELLDQLDSKLVKEYHSSSFGNKNCFIIVSGNPPSDIIERINNQFGQFQNSNSIVSSLTSPIDTNQKKFEFKLENKNQTAIKIGKRLFNRNHPDFASMFLVNMILGGFFGSRLVKTIRENKGFTYNIYSSIDALVHDGYFYIGTEVDSNAANETSEIIRSEIEKLRIHPIEPQELEMVKNYLNGNFLNLLDGPFMMGNILKTIELEDRKIEDVESFFTKIQNTSSDDVNGLVQKHLSIEDLIEVRVG